jgi:hypothetical protein
MSATLDLAGATTTLIADSTSTYYQVTDSVGGGTLVLSAGAILNFDDSAGAGFTTATDNITITINGNSSSPSYIQSVSSVPSWRWSMPPTTSTMNATRCYFVNGNGPETSSTWIFNNCFFDTGSSNDGWCTIEDVEHATGTALDDVTVQAIIDSAQREINAYLKPLGVSGDSSLREACLRLAIARLYTRYDLIGQLTNGTINGSIADHEKTAWALVDKWVGYKNSQVEIKRWVQI